MVRKLTKADQAALSKAAKKAEQQTAAELSIVVVPASGDYYEFILLYGLLLGSLGSFALWATDTVTDYSLLLIFQIAVILILDLVPWLRNIVIRLVPKHIRHKRAAREAMHQYHQLHAQIPAHTAFILLYVSLAERYVHVVTNPVVHKKIPGNWEIITGHFISAIREHGLRTACTEALQRIGEILAIHFPAK